MASGPTIGSTALILAADDKKFRAGLDSARDRFKKFRQQTTADAKSIKDEVSAAFGGMFGKAAAVGGGLFAGLSLTSLLTDSVKLAAEMEDAAASFKVMVSSAERGEALFREIESTADDMRMSMREVAEAARDLLASDVGEDEVVETLRMLGDLALGDAAKLKVLANAYAKVRDEGVVTSKTLRAFQGAGVFLGDDLAKVKGTDRAGLKKLLDEDMVGFRDLVAAMQAATGEGGRFFGALDARAETFAGKIDQLGNAWDDFKWKLGQVLIEEFGLSELFDKITATVKEGEGGLDNLRPLFRDVRDFVADMAADLYEGGWEFARAIASAKDSLGSLKADWEDVRTLLGIGQVFRLFGGGGPATGSAEQAVIDAKARADAIWRRGGGDGAGEWIRGGVGKDFDFFTGEVIEAAEALDLLGKAAKADAERMAKSDAELFKRIRDEWDPVGKIERELAQLLEAVGRGAFDKDPGAFRFRRAQLLAERDKLLAGEPFVPKAAGLSLRDSREAGEAIIAAQLRGLGVPKAEDKVLNKLEQQRKLAQEQRDAAKEAVRVINLLLGRLGGAF